MYEATTQHARLALGKTHLEAIWAVRGEAAAPRASAAHEAITAASREAKARRGDSLAKAV